MLPDRLIDFIHGPHGLYVGTRDEELRPSIAMALGAVADAQAETIRFFLPDVEGGPTVRNLRDNGLVAMTVLNMLNEAYQFKGRFVEARPSDANDRAVQMIYRSKTISHQIERLPNIEALIDGYVLEPSTTVTLKVEEVFVQTPGPGAGDKLNISSEILA